MLKNFLIIIASFFIYSCDKNNNDDLILSCNDINTISELDDFNLEDLNPNSNTFGENIGPSYFQNQGQVISMSVFNWET